MATVPLLFVVGVSLAFWSVVAVLRRLAELRRPERPVPPHRLTPRDVAVIIPARNEEMIISATIRSVLRLVKPGNIHVVADGCDDDTGLIALSWGLNVLEPMPARGKAAGIEAVVRDFDLPGRFRVLLIVDADTELDEHYLERALPLFDDPEVVAVAGYAKASWRPQELTLMGRLLVAYRTRLYAVMQWIKYAQTWRRTNVTSIVPGFASMYRTSVLAQMDLNPPGLVIEDFNMTFEVHHKRLGKIAFRPDIGATTQDPDNLPDYYKQITRWQLGLWQTVRRHRLWPQLVLPRAGRLPARGGDRQRADHRAGGRARRHPAGRPGRRAGQLGLARRHGRTSSARTSPCFGHPAARGAAGLPADLRDRCRHAPAQPAAVRAGLPAGPGHRRHRAAAHAADGLADPVLGAVAVAGPAADARSSRRRSPRSRGGAEAAEPGPLAGPGRR